ncbi:trna dihydrouridine synthase b [hydrocarbon metagenome]|uniref:Trna dihydrouridine synthase b n=1 Tax=hydrocarbon metagenome TaxID=938273 RepID=A0A0W8FVX3_9ZZZZ
MQIGQLDFSKRLLLAPMADITDNSFREIAKKFGAGLTFTQMVSAKGVLENDFETLRYLAFNKNEKPIGVQLLGNDPELIGSAVREIAKYKPDVIDINCGCPVDNVTKYKMGACLLNSPQLIGKIISNMKKAAGDIHISAKMRLGDNEKTINIIENAKAAEDNGASFIIVHARTKKDKYDIDAKWEWISEVKNAINIPIVGNGSVFSADDALRMKHETGVDSVMVARGALGNPFIFSRFNSIVDNNFDPGDPGIDLVKETALEHCEKLIREYGDLRALNFMKKNIIWYYKNYYGIINLVNNLMSCNSAAGVIDIVNEHTEKIRFQYYPEEDLQIIQQKFKMKVLFWLVQEPVFSEAFG